jgi:hypothetical protein
MQLRRLLATATVALAATTSLAACGANGDKPTAGDDEGVYVNTGDLAYQVQISRQLNQNDFEDRDYLLGLPAGSGLASDEEYFAVFIRVFNKTNTPHMSASKFQIRDTTGQTYDPIAINTNANRVAYRPMTLNGGDQLPLPGSLARENLTQGGLILFKVKNSTYDNRPLELNITPPDGGREATVDLDV